MTVRFRTPAARSAVNYGLPEHGLITPSGNLTTAVTDKAAFSLDESLGGGAAGIGNSIRGS
jgi:hypothetical protein